MKKKTLIIAFILFIILSIAKIIYDESSLNRNFKYTTGLVLQIKPVKGGKAIIFEYSVNNQLYRGSKIIYDLDRSLVGKKFKVKYNPNNPNNCNLLLERPL